MLLLVFGFKLRGLKLKDKEQRLAYESQYRLREN